MILGICDGHDGGAALVAPNGETIFAVSEERLSRKKRQSGFPVASVQACLKRSPEIQAVAVAERAGRFPFRALDSIYRRVSYGGGPLGLFPRALATYSSVAAHRFAGLEEACSRRVLRSRLRRMGLEAPLMLVDHHLCHARTAAAGREASLVVTLDAFGDGLSGSIYRGHQDGALELMRTYRAPTGPAMLFAQTTHLLGFSEGEEGKVVARAARGDGRVLREHFERTLRWDGHRFVAGLSTGDFRRGLTGHDPVDIAAGLQGHVERLVADLLRTAIDELGGRSLCLAGGLFANVAVNRVALEIGREEGFEEVFVFPAMGDAGLCVGAAMEALARAGGTPKRLTDPRVGPEADVLEDDLLASIPIVCSEGAQGGMISEAARTTLVGALKSGKLIASCRGRLEFGPRALGARSFLLLADKRERAQRLNTSLGRDSEMPFGPVMTSDRASELLEGWGSICRDMTGAMTVALPASECLRRLAPAAVHHDGTARAQVIDRDFDPPLFDLLSELPGGVCINTSLNLHGEPIVTSVGQAARSAQRAGADLLWLD